MHSERPLALVTGARRGIGAAIALELASSGFDLAITDKHEEGSEEILAALRAIGAQASFHLSDLADVAHHLALVERIVQQHGSIRCLVNNAGVPAPHRGDLLDMSPDSFDLVHDVNMRGTFFLTQCVARHMVSCDLAPPCSIVTISSVSAQLASVERGEYCLSKAGLAMLTKLFALRLADRGIGVFEVRPGIIRTSMTDPVSAKYDEAIRSGLVPAARWGLPEDVARVVAALASGRLGFATGSVINVDGALSVPRL